MAGVGSGVAFLDLNYSKFSQGLKSAAAEARSGLKDIDNAMAGGFQSAGSAMMSAGAKLTALTTVPIAAAGAWGLNIATNFEEGMSGVKAITNATEEEFNGLRETAIQLGADTKYSSQEVADGMTIMAKAGWDSQQIMDGMAGVLDAAAASGENVSRVSEVMANTITGFGLAASESTHVADVLTQVANSGTVDITDLGESFKYCASACRPLGVSFEDASQALLAMSTAGIKGSQAGTTLRRILVNLTGGSASATQAMEELGLQVTNEDGSFRNFNDILADCREKMSGMTDAEKAHYAQQIAGTTGMSGFLTMLNMTTEEYAALGQEIENCDGIAQRTAETMQDNLANDLEKLGGSLESLAIKLGDILIPHLRKFIQWLDKLVDSFVKMSPEQQEFIVKMAGIIAAIGPCLVIVGKLTSTIGKGIEIFGKAKEAIRLAGDGFRFFSSCLQGISVENLMARFGGIPDVFNAMSGAAHAASPEITGLGKVFGLLTSPIGIAVGVIALAVASFITLWNTSEEFRNAITGIFQAIGEKFAEIGAKLQPVFDKLGQFLSWLIDVFGQGWMWFCNTIASPILIGAFEVIGGLVTGLLDILTGLLEFIVGVFSGDWQMAWQGICDFFNGIWEGIGGVLQGVWDAIWGVISNIINQIGPAWNSFWQGVGDFFSTIWQGICDFFTGIAEAISTAVSDFCTAVGQWFTDTFNAISQWASDTWNSISEWCGNLVGACVDQVSQWASSVGQWFSDVATNIGNWATDTWNNISNWCSNLVNDAVNSVSNFASGCANWFENAKNTVSNFVRDALNAIGNWARDMANKATNAARDFWNNLSNGLQAAVRGVVSIGGDIVRGIWNGITGMAGWLWGQISGFCSNIVNNIKSFFHIGSPSKLMADQVGAPIVQGIGQGVEEAAPGVGDQIETDIEDMIDNVDVKDKEVNVDVITKFWESGKSWRDELLAGFDKFAGNLEHLVDRLMGPDLSKYSESFLHVMKASAKVLPESEINETNRDLVDALLGRPVGIARYLNGTTITGIDYTKLGQEMANALRQVPIEPDIDIEMQQGDVLLDSERVGRALVPTISRLLVGGNQPLPR